MEVLVDDFVTVLMPTDFYGVGQWYEDFSQIDDDTVYEILRMGQKLNPAEAL
jgi:putative phosphoribosyl transferase